MGPSTTGDEYVTLFFASLQGWFDDDLPLNFLFSTGRTDGTTLVQSLKTEVPMFETSLSRNATSIVGRVYDSYG